jgi:chromosome segregation ATPase
MKKSTAKKRPGLAEAGVRLQARVERISKLEQTIDGLHRQLNQVNPGVKLNEKWAARHLVDSAKFALSGCSDSSQRAMCKKSLQAEQERCRLAEVAHQEEEAKEQRLRAELAAAENELADLRRGCGIEEALSFQQSLDEAEKRIPEVKALIEEQERLIQEAKATIPSADTLQERREDILAGLSTGDATEAQLNAVDQELEALNAQIADASAKASEILGKAEPTLAGLRRKLKEAEEYLEELLLQKPEVTRLVLKSEAALVYFDYLKLGQELGEKFVRLMSLNALICSVPERRHVDHSILLMASVMKIPRFKIGPDAEAPSMSTVFSAVEQRIDLAREVEKQRLQAEGLTLLD